MFQNLSIQGFRAFPALDVNDLRRINLIVGRNNAGKTCVLEAAHLLACEGNPSALKAGLIRRAETFASEEPDGTISSRGNLTRLFNEYEGGGDCRFRIAANGPTGPRVLAGIYDYRPTEEERAKPSLHGPPPGMRFFLGYKRPGEKNEGTSTWLLQPDETVSLSNFEGRTARVEGRTRLASRRERQEPGVNQMKVRFITTAAMQADTVVELFEQIVLSPEEGFITSALRILEPNLERIAVGATRANTSYILSARGGRVRGEILVLNRGRRLPIGSMGDGMWRILGLALGLVHAANGYLFVDEIDTGLHYTAMTDMWRLIDKTAQRLNVQIFATTHSRDCVDALATVCREVDSTSEDVSIQRIDRDKPVAVGYSQQEIIAAAEHGVEVR